jgi:hypothetical protein
MNYSKAQDPRQWAKWSMAGAVSTSYVKVNLAVMAQRLERLAVDYQAVEAAGNPFTEFGLALPENYPRNYLRLARDAADALDTHPHKERLQAVCNPTLVKRGYELLKSHTVPARYILPPSNR